MARRATTVFRTPGSLRREPTPAELTLQKHEVIFRPLQGMGRGYWTTMTVLLGFILWGGYSYYLQVSQGLSVTGLNRPIFWGMYIVNFVFFIAISYGGTLTSAILRLGHAEWRRPITRLAEVITVCALLVGSFNVIMDMGRPDRLWRSRLGRAGRETIRAHFTTEANEERLLKHLAGEDPPPFAPTSRD